MFRATMLMIAATMVLATVAARADEYDDALAVFKAADSATAITGSVSATAGTIGASATASATKNDAATTDAAYTDGMAVFTVAEGGLMYEASVADQKFSYKPKK